MTQDYTFEICAINIHSAMNAEVAGAHRIELCSAIDAGGLTPSPGLILTTIRNLQIPVHVLIRPREGNFWYSEEEFRVMLDDIRFCREAGAHGVVVGALTSGGALDLPKMEAMRREAGDIEVICHRAFDFTRDPAEALEQLINLGFQRVLSSGQADNAYKGRNVLGKLVAQAAGRIVVMAGSGITAANIREIAADSGVKDFHFTGKIKVQAKAGQDIKGLDSSYWLSDQETIREVMNALGFSGEKGDSQSTLKNAE